MRRNLTPRVATLSRAHTITFATILAGLIGSSAMTASAAAITDTPPHPIAFDEDGILEAHVRRTEFGVPHIKADNLESLSFGTGYAFSQDNACMLMDIVNRYNSRRSRFHGPDRVPGTGDNQNLFTDFAYLTMGIRTLAELNYETLTDNSKAMISGYTKGFNHYLEETGSDNLDPHCAGQDWVYPIDDLDMLTVLLGTALLPGAGQFAAPLFLAAPPGQDPAPVPVTGVFVPLRKQPVYSATLPVLPHNDAPELASNAWALGSEVTESGKGLLLANPHFPFTGNLRFWQFHAIIPGSLNVMGSSLYGTPGVVNIGFNEHLAWSHTFSTAEHFVVYQLELDADDPTGLTYKVDGRQHQMESQTLSLEVLVAPGQTITVNKTVYYSRFGPMISVPDALPWGEKEDGSRVAYSIKDVNLGNLDIVDHWLAMNLATDMEQFKQSFRDYDGTLFNNTLAVDRHGNSFFTDDSAVPNLNLISELALRFIPSLKAARALLGFSLLPGNSIIFDYRGPVPFRQTPKLESTRFVQNSNDSYWLTQPQHPMYGHSILYGPTHNQQTLRSRMSQQLLRDSAGENGLFNAAEVEAALFSQRAYLAEALLEDLIAHCQQQGDTPVSIEIEQTNEEGEASTTSVDVNIAPACLTLRHWDGRFYRHSRGAHLFREFAQQFEIEPQWQVPFSRKNPTRTPNTLLANETVLQQLAKAVWILEQAGVALDARLGEVQFVSFTNADGNPDKRLPWGGANNIEGGFNVFRSQGSNDSAVIPAVYFPPLEGSQISAEAGGYHVTQGSSWMMVVDFKEDAPKARGLMTYSQSIDERSPHRDDQSLLYSDHPRLRPVRFAENEIQDNMVSEIHVSRDTGQR